MEKAPESPPIIKLSVAPELGKLGIKARGAVIEGVDVKRTLSNPLKKELKEVARRLDIESILKSQTLEGYRELYETYKEEAKPAAQWLLSAIQKSGKLPNINNVVDIYNSVAAETGLAIGAHDLSKINGNVEIRATTGSERYTPILETEPAPVPPGKYAAVDESGEVLCFMELKQSNVTKIVPNETKDIFVYVQGNKEVSDEDIENALLRICEKITQFCGGSYTMIQ